MAALLVMIPFVFSDMAVGGGTSRGTDWSVEGGNKVKATATINLEEGKI